MSSNDTDDIRSELQKYNQSTWGLVIYRCTYGDEAKWARFMTILNERSRAFLKSNDNLEDLMTSLDCSVQEDPSLDGASINEVRRRFREWVTASGVTPHLTPRYAYCIHVDTGALESVLNGP